MTTWELRKIFRQEILPPLFLDNPDSFYEAFENGPEAVKAFIAAKWVWMCEQLKEDAGAYPMTFEMDCIAFDETEANFLALLTVELPEADAPEESGAALYFSVFFGAPIQPRLFFGEYARLKKPNDTIAIMETHLIKDGDYQHTKRAVLFQGCNNRPVLFEPPAHPLPVDSGIPLNRDDWYTAYMDEVVRICEKGYGK